LYFSSFYNHTIFNPENLIFSSRKFSPTTCWTKHGNVIYSLGKSNICFEKGKINGYH